MDVLLQKKFCLDLRMVVLMVKNFYHWNKLPREVGTSPLLETMKAWLDGALDNLV